MKALSLEWLGRRAAQLLLAAQPGIRPTTDRFVADLYTYTYAYRLLAEHVTGTGAAEDANQVPEATELDSRKWAVREFVHGLSGTPGSIMRLERLLRHTSPASLGAVMTLFGSELNGSSIDDPALRSVARDAAIFTTRSTYEALQSEIRLLLGAHGIDFAIEATDYRESTPDR